MKIEIVKESYIHRHTYIHIYTCRYVSLGKTLVGVVVIIIVVVAEVVVVVPAVVGKSLILLRTHIHCAQQS